jgi:hypothetical protein
MPSVTGRMHLQNWLLRFFDAAVLTGLVLAN